MKFAIIVICILFSLKGHAQSAELANAYFRKGEYEKAILLYQPLFESNPIRQDYFKSLLTCYQQVDSFTDAQTLIEGQIQRFPEQVYLFVELGYNYQLQGNLKLAEQYYEQSLNYVKQRPNYGFMIGRSFRQNHLLDQALQSYQIAKELNPKLNTEISEAQIYGEKGDLDKMFDLYLDLVDKNENYFSTVQRYVASFISGDKYDPNNILFKKLLLKRAQTNQKDAWNILLSWLFMQQQEYKKALTQEKSLFNRKPGSLERIQEIGYISFENKDYETSANAFEFMLSKEEEVIIDAQATLFAEIYLLKIENNTLKKGENRERIDGKFEELIHEYGYREETLELHLAYADFLTFDFNKPEKAIQHLEKISERAETPFQKGLIDMKTADILVFTNQFNQALIKYTKIQYDLKNSELAQEARFKVARTSYFKGDFQWAQNQLKVLKSSTSQLIANDALGLSLKIGNNIDKDSLNEGLQIYARAELLGFQQKYKQAIDTLSYVLTQFKGQQIEDDALFSQAVYYQNTGDYKAAELNLLSLLDFHPESLLIDDSIFTLGELYRDHLNEPEKAKSMFERIIFEFPSSIYLVDARASFRKLRGDEL
ncbi:tetratricopeptide repeat protein [Lutimonas vermicola]|uniref:Tetratricopeptide repeat protein n=1 Tax=Lutimonas vermicola TaxID=414288 RepID=A0ABU9L147_9FLAO